MNDALSSLFALSLPREGSPVSEPSGPDAGPSPDLDFSSAFERAFARLQTERQVAAGLIASVESVTPVPAQDVPALRQVPLGAELTLVVPSEVVPDHELAAFAQSQGIPLATLAQLQGRAGPQAPTQAISQPGSNSLPGVDLEGAVLAEEWTEMLPSQDLARESGLDASSEALPSNLNDSTLEEHAPIRLKLQVTTALTKAMLDRRLDAADSIQRQAPALARLDPIDLSEFGGLFEMLAVDIEVPTRRVASTHAFLSASGLLPEGALDQGIASRVAAPGEGAGAGLGQGQMGGETARMLAQQLSQKFGELMSQRLIQQVQQGQWKVELELHPADLGAIEVELNWNGGELEAIFRAAHGTTRDLLQENLPKLRTALEQSGTDVAYLGVGGDQRRQSGDQSSRKESGDRRAPADSLVVVEPDKRASSSIEGLNIWV